MIAVDTNVLVHAHREESRLHTLAKKRVIRLAEGSAPWAIPVFCIGEFLRVITHARVFDPPFTAREGAEAVGRLLASPSLRVLHPGELFLPLLCETVHGARAVGNLVFDAQIVALCREHAVSALLTEDRDFARFEHIEAVHLE